MMNQNDRSRQDRHIALYTSADHPCSYLDDRLARTLFVDPTIRVDSATYQALIDQGFRRSGTHVYRPACNGCNECVPVRVPVERFVPNRSQRRNWKSNAPEILLRERPAEFDAEHFALYRRYLERRHPDGGMAEDATEESYRRFLVDPWGGQTRFVELRLDARLVGVAVTDVLKRGLSAVYTFFDPELSARAPGTFAVLAQIELTRRVGLPYLYLGYCISDSRKMAYKTHFRPVEAWNGQEWRPLCNEKGRVTKRPAAHRRNGNGLE
ncbi:arginyl-tRNA--protein transferase [Thiorhodococcus drewsii AZ1]|uniref:Aspartate/glutamate leucyltransferase n=2 Tax=Thiorhodococcus drewsii TaxID=210408 RepID=G2DWB5_9GAMM|nr:arginyl-tRNA--protein transferase [Thiorhodococcus drewsii AZ1]